MRWQAIKQELSVTTSRLEACQQGYKQRLFDIKQDKDLFQLVGGYREGFEGSQDHDLALCLYVF